MGHSPFYYHLYMEIMIIQRVTLEDGGINAYCIPLFML